MGQGFWTNTDWDAYDKQNVRGKSQAQVFKSQRMQDACDPSQITWRESRDSDDHPESTPIILATDVTGSMGAIVHTLMKEGLNTLIEAIYDRQPVKDPHVMVMALGDSYCDRAPLQVTQFEADIRVAKQVSDLWIERGGGGNGGESYALAHLFAAQKTSTDAFEKRGKKGYLFTIGDEPIHQIIKAGHAAALGLGLEKDMTAQEAIALASQTWEVYHIALVREGYCTSVHGREETLNSWQKTLPERVVQLEDLSALAETVVSLIQVREGAQADAVAASWSDSRAVAVASALKSLPGQSRGNGLRRLGR